MGINFLEAARRAYHDGTTLCRAERYGTADHLFGLAAECGLKAVLVGLNAIPRQGPPRRSRFRVHVDKLWDEYATHIAGRGDASLLLSLSAPFAAWSVDHRYEADQTFDQKRTRGHHQGAEDVFRVLEAAIASGYPL
jgi:hypothetical protein